jgi:hypothetical protein
VVDQDEAWGTVADVDAKVSSGDWWDLTIVVVFEQMKQSQLLENSHIERRVCEGNPGPWVG